MRNRSLVRSALFSDRWAGYRPLAALSQQAIAQVLADDQVRACWSARVGALVSRPWRVEPASRSARDVAVADRVRAVLERIDMDALTRHCLEAVLWGHAAAELIWSPPELAEWVPIPRGWLQDGDGVLPIVMTPTGRRIELPASKLMLVTHEPEHVADWRGRALVADLATLVTLKSDVRQFAAVYADKLSIPPVLGKVPPGSSEADRDAWLTLLARLASDTAVVVPDNLTVEMLAQRGQPFDFVGLIHYLDEAIARLIVGQTMTSLAGSSRAQAEVHQDTARLITAADAELVDGAIQRAIVAPLVALLDRGAEPPLVYHDLDDPKDLTARVERDEVLYRIGYRLRPEAVREVYGDHYEPREVAPAATGRVDRPSEPSSTEEGGRNDESVADLAEWGEDPATALDALARRVDRRAAGPVAAMVRSLEGLIDGARDLEDLRRRIVATWPDLDRASLAAVLGDAVELASLAGRIDVLTEAEEARRA